MKILKIIGFFILSIAMLLAILLVYFTLVDFRPEDRIIISEQSGPDSLDTEIPIDILNWNIGYAGLGSEMDFFYDGGENVRTTREKTEENLVAISGFLEDNDSIPFIVLQEVDLNSKRTYRIDQQAYLNEKLDDYHTFHALNYSARFVPMPPTEPMGRVQSGLLTATRFKPEMVERFDYPGSYAWPTRIFMLDRCFMVARYPMKSGNKLLVINSHNSAFDDGSLKKQEMEYLASYLKEQYEAGNYVIVAADWNQNPPGLEGRSFSETATYEGDAFSLTAIEKDFMPDGWKWVFDPEVPTNRDLTSPFEEGRSFTTILDFLLISPNIKVGFVKTIDLKFSNADHQPVIARLYLKEKL
jgi:endonuclease/exonuclease/phosphatase family metal-dependent hydrolase